MKKLETFTASPNVVYMMPHEPIDENEKINLSQEVLPRSPEIRIENRKLVRFSGENEFSLKLAARPTKSIPISARKETKAYWSSLKN
ncbi:hypothetical protein V1226_23840 [Lachnospiraceae bacterium JLR.KK009]|nr:hypothetical protein C810_03608 [Lachnospiraceae bacterium A2]